MQLNLVDKLLLLALNDEKGSFMADSITFQYGLAGAAVYVLSKEDRIDISNGTVSIKSQRTLRDEALDYCLNKIANSKKERSPKYWINYFGERGRNIRKPILKKLITGGILEEKESKFLWIFPNNKYPTKNAIPENSIKIRLNDIIFGNKDAEVDEIMLISLVDSCKLHKEVFNNKITKEQKTRIKNILSDSKLAGDTHKVLKEIHETIVAAIVVLLATTTITTT